MPKLSSRLRGTDAEDRLTQGGGDGLGDKDGVGDDGEAEEPPGLLIQADVVLPHLPVLPDDVDLVNVENVL